MKIFYSKAYDDIYFNPENPEAEKEFVFIRGNNLPARFEHSANLVVAELGFGYGLSCALLLTAARDVGYSGQLDFYSVEENLPALDAALRLLPRLTHAREAYAALWQQREAICRGETVSIFGASVTVFPGQVRDFLALSKFQADAWFFDGFAPAKNPTMWSYEVFASAFALTHVNGTFATYSSAGWVRRNLATAGFVVKKMPGFGSKREMLTGIKN